MPFIFLVLDKARSFYAQGNVSPRSKISVQRSITLRPPTAELYSQQVRCFDHFRFNLQFLHVLARPHKLAGQKIGLCACQPNTKSTRKTCY
jgi:hypothetical protein